MQSGNFLARCAVAVLTAALCLFLACRKDKCRDVACLNGGSCDDGTCVCTGGYSGERCELDPCHDVNCLNGGTCESGTCACPAGYEGTSCDTLSRDKFIGTYLADGTYACPGSNTPQPGYPLFIETGTGHQGVVFYLGGSNTLTAHVNKDSMIVESQTVNAHVFEGTGVWRNDSLFVVINETDPTDNETCVYTFGGPKD